MVRTLHEIPVLPRDIIELAGQRPHLSGSDLAEAVQRVRFTPTVMDVDETSKLWGMLHQTPYTLSVVYQAVLVLIDGRGTPVPAKPVERPEVRVLPFGAPGAPSPGPVGEEPVVPSREPAEPAGTPAKAAAGTEAKAPAKTTRSRKSAQPARTGQPARAGKKAAAKSAKAKPARPQQTAGTADSGEDTEN